ncbi:MAG: hypothetical protein WC518_04285 [Patescibacteria group bacterium]
MKGTTILLLISLSLVAQGLEWKTGGQLELRGDGYFSHKSSEAEDAFAEMRLKPKVTAVFSKHFLIHAEGDLRLDSAGFAQGVFDDSTGHRPIVGARELYAETSWKWLRLRLGKQVFDWSVTDTVSPNDNICPRDLTDVIDWERMGVPAVDIRLGYDKYLELVYVPWFTPSRLPASERWGQALPNNLELGEPENGHGQLALRAGCTIKGWDLGASFYDGLSYTPSFELKLPKQIIPTYREEQVIAISLATEISSGYNLRAEAGYFRQKNADDFLQCVVGVDHEWNKPFRKTDSLSVLLQYAFEVETRKETPDLFRAKDFRRGLDGALLYRIKYTPNDTGRWSVELSGSLNLEHGDAYFEPSLTWRKDDFEVKAGLGVPLGEKDTFMGQYRENPRCFAETAWKF